MDELVENVFCVMAALDSRGAKELVNENVVFERLETCSTSTSKAGTDLVNHVVRSFLIEFGIPTEDYGNEADVVIIDNTKEEKGPESTKSTTSSLSNVSHPSTSAGSNFPSLAENSSPEVSVLSPGLIQAFEDPFTDSENSNSGSAPDKSDKSSSVVISVLKSYSDKGLPKTQEHKPLSEATGVETKVKDDRDEWDDREDWCRTISISTSNASSSKSHAVSSAFKSSGSPNQSSASTSTSSASTSTSSASGSTSSASGSTSSASTSISNASTSTFNFASPKKHLFLPPTSQTGAIPKTRPNPTDLMKSSTQSNSVEGTQAPPIKNDVMDFSGSSNASVPNQSAATVSSSALPKSKNNNLGLWRINVKSDVVKHEAGSSNATLKEERGFNGCMEQMDMDEPVPKFSPGKRSSDGTSNEKKKIKTERSHNVATRVATLSDMFPEADPEYLWLKSEQLVDEAAFNSLIDGMLINNDYPRVHRMKQNSNASAAAGSEKDLPVPENLVGHLKAAVASTSQVVEPKAVTKVASLSEVKRRISMDTVYAEAAPVQEPREPWQDQLDTFIQILPDADPSFLEEKARQLHGKENELREFVAQVIETKEYPSRKDWMWRQEQLALQKKYTEEFSIPNFLEIFPDPFTYFADPNRQCPSKTQGAMFLRNKYRKLRVADITSVFNQKGNNLTLTCRALDNWAGATLKARRHISDYDITRNTSGKGVDVPFLQEIAFIENEKKIVDYLEAKKQRRETAFNEAKAKGELLQCQCCYDDEVLSEDVRTCLEGHIFCISCLQKSSEQRIGDGHTSFPCLADCSSEFKLHTLQEILKPTVFSRLVQRKQAEEVKAAGIEDLVQCPFCDFCNIPPREDKVFRCLNPDCMKESCRLCKEDNHVPLRCDEVEKKGDIEMRTYIENKMTEALVRTCWKCQKKFVKEDGCNKMTCQCGAKMCYICRQPVQDYSHFNGQGGEAFDKCPLYSDHHALEAAEVKKVAEQAKKEVLARKPNATLKHDPTKLLPVFEPPAHPQPVDYYGSDEESDYASSVYDSDEGDYDQEPHFFHRRHFGMFDFDDEDFGDVELEEEEDENEAEEEGENEELEEEEDENEAEDEGENEVREEEEDENEGEEEGENEELEEEEENDDLGQGEDDSEEEVFQEF